MKNKGNLIIIILTIINIVVFIIYLSVKPVGEIRINIYVPEDTIIEEEEEPELELFKLTAYCPCKECSGKWGNLTASGKKAKQGRTIAVDKSIIPLGTQVKIKNKVYVAEDVGGAVKGKHIDVYLDSHKETVNFGVKYINVEILEEVK